MQVSSRLLKWFGRHKRPLPWRKTRDPYRIWVSEIMLQQTQVNTVVPYYERWMKNFPTLRRLANAPLARILKCWEGLGYYSRARNLHRAAKVVTQKFGGRIPDSREELLQLPGIGRYTAGAIASIAFSKPEPILDGNVKRVLARLFAVKEPIDTTRGEKRLWEISRALVESEPKSPGDLNQSLMELGALVCLPENPQCGVCPLEKICRAHRLEKELDFPIKLRKTRLEKLKTVAAIIWKKGRVLLQKQDPESRWGGLWTFPYWIHTNGKSEKDFLQNKMVQELGIRTGKLNSRAELQHAFTKYRVRLRVYEGEARSVRQKLTWVEPGKISGLPLPRPHQRIAEMIQNHA